MTTKKKLSTGFIVVAALLFAGCRHGNGIRPGGETHEHSTVAGDDHDHDHDHGHDHDHDHDHDHERLGHAGEITFTQAQAEAAGLEVEAIVPGPFAEVIKTSGQILSSQGDETAVVATSSGIVSFAGASVSEGCAVKAGQTIVTISAKNLPDGDPAAKAKIAYEAAEKEYLRAQSLVDERIVSDKDFDRIRSAYETAKTVYDAQSGSLSPNGIAVASPMSGYIKSRTVTEGDYVAVGQLICIVSQNRRLQLRAEVPENHFNRLGRIADANFSTSYDNAAYKLSDLDGRLLSFGKVADGQSSCIPVTFEFNNAGSIIPGAFVTVYLLSAPQDDILSVPVSAITEEQGLYFVYIRSDDETYRKQEVKPGDNDGARVRILWGLQQGDRVVTKGAYQVKLAAAANIIPEGHSHNH